MAREGSSARRRLETPVEEAREDFRPPEWLKKSRDDVPPNNRPLPESPLTILNRRNRSSADGGSSQRSGQDRRDAGK